MAAGKQFWEIIRTEFGSNNEGTETQENEYVDKYAGGDADC